MRKKNKTRSLTEKQIAQIRTLSAKGLSARAVAGKVGCAERTVYSHR